jgi:hypothetical protein
VRLIIPGRDVAMRAHDGAGLPLRHQRQEWLALGLALLLGTTIGWLLYSENHQITSGELDRLHAQTRVIDDNLIFQLEGAAKALESVRGEFLLPRRGDSPVALSARMKVRTDVMPCVWTMTVLDTNVLVRFLVQDDARQGAAAARLIRAGAEAGSAVFVPVMRCSARCRPTPGASWPGAPSTA